MGQAKRRGTFEERVALARERVQVLDQARHRDTAVPRLVRRVGRTVPYRPGMFVALAAALARRRGA